jgi:hypothetical protein
MPQDNNLQGNVVRWDKKKDLPRRIIGKIEVEQKRTPEETIRTFLAKNKAILKLKTGKKELKLIQNVESLIGRHLRFQQYINDIPVFGGIVVVHIDKYGKVRELKTDHELDSLAQLVTVAKMCTQADAEKIARTAIKEPIKLRPKAKIQIEKYYYPTEKAIILSWCITIPTLNPPHHWRVFVDAYTRAVLSVEDMIDFSVEGEGLIFNPNPVVTANDNTFLDGTTLEATLNAEQETVPLHELENPVGGLHYLRGPYVEIIELAAPAIGIPSQATASDFKYDRTNDNFEAVMVYYHIDAYQRYIRDVLGITTACPITPPDTRIHADPHDNSLLAAWFDPGTHDLHFSDSGPGVPDRAEDGDCMIHEYGHAILHFQVAGWHAPVPATDRYEARAIGEGFGDVSACLCFVQAGNGYQREVFEDWIFAPGGLRRVDNPTDYSAFQTGSTMAALYQNCTIWSGSIWDIFLAMGGDSAIVADWAAPRDALLKALITSHSLYSASEPMPDAAEALMATHSQLVDQRGLHAIQMLDVFHDRKLLECAAGSDIRLNRVWPQKDNLSVRGWEEAEFGQDNWFYAEITNAGANPARALVVTFSFKCPFSTPVYPPSFRDNITSATVEFDLAAGETRTVSALWPKELVPAIPPGADSIHGCMFCEIYNPVDCVPPGVTTIGGSNHKLMYCNITIKDMLPDTDADFEFDISNFNAVKEEIARLEVVRPQKWQNLDISLHHHNPEFIKGFHRKIEDIQKKNVGLAEFVRNDADIIVEKDKSFLKLRPGLRVGVPFLMKPRDRAKLKVKIKSPKDAKPGEKFTVRMSQHNAKGELIGGFDVQVNIVDKIKKRKKVKYILPILK